MVQEARFRYSAPLANWSDSQLEALHRLWLRNVKGAATLSRSMASAPLVLPTYAGGKTIRQPQVVMIQALATHVAQTIAFDDKLRAMARSQWNSLALSLGTHIPKEMGTALARESRPRDCPFARLLRAAALLDLEVVLPLELTGPPQVYRTWEGLRAHICEHRLVLGEEETQLLQNWAKGTLPFRVEGL